MLIRQTAGYSGLTNTAKPVAIDAKMLAKLRDSQSSDTNKVINLAKGIQATLNEKDAVPPYLISIGERAEAIRDHYDERQALPRRRASSWNCSPTNPSKPRRPKKETGLAAATFPLYWELKRLTYNDPKKLAQAIVQPFRRFPDFNSNADEMRLLKAELYKLLLPGGAG